MSNSVRDILKRWDKGSPSVRQSMLKDFLAQCVNATVPDLEQYFNDCGSLFLARLTSWLRLTYVSGLCLQLQLRSINVFITAGNYFLMEFLEVGGMLTVLEIVGLKSSREEDKAEALKLLTVLANKGRQCKELLCESFGVKIVAENLAISKSAQTQETAQNFLLQLSTGNPRYQSQVYKALIALLSSASSEAQRMSAITLRQIQPSMGVVSAAIVEPALQLLKSLHVEVQHEAIELLKDLVSYEEVQQSILMGLVGLLKPSTHDTNLSKDSGTSQLPLIEYIQQAGAAKAISALIQDDENLGEKLLDLRVAPHLLYAMGNIAYVDSQRQAGLCICVLVELFPSAREDVKTIMGEDFFLQFIGDPEKCLYALTPSQVDVLIAALNSETGVH